jgi:hypothetical protein
MKNSRSYSFSSGKVFFSSLSFVLVVMLSSWSINSNAQVGTSPIIGHWDLTVNMGNHSAPSWMEVKLSGFKTLVGYFVGDAGSARPVAKINFENNKVSFSIPPQWETGNNDMIFEGTLEDGKLSGTITDSYGKSHPFTGVKAPTLEREKPPVWGEPIKLFNGQNLDGWFTQRPMNQWVVENGVLKSPKSGSNLITKQKFEDFKLHIEFKYPSESNSGVYLRGRYEVQIIDSRGQEPSSVLFGGVYGFLTPNQEAANPAGEWNSYDITLIGRRVTVVANGKTIICDALIPGITGGALDSNEAEPGPILLQGDHGPIEYRNIVITPAK